MDQEQGSPRKTKHFAKEFYNTSLKIFTESSKFFIEMCIGIEVC